ncbi:MAG TPA: SGNH/GDSL hydrolase family protein [candidate division Zixibacteria bacterium]|nr:SGNH/GDSL hydrolase family protein [candidate division Zixibacteria bacterium]MDD4917519.1 SGNH/GDSL hydrolase family protein [candidate division Zixibacteria bacterium]MDM7972212.1 SGNH/GDSL hydrolase family protein [candidate division Zixibacteria bacterium]HOD66745.1 SGNH/GDSL hydrolase family protein [candidate division Zixibacteria bacterium]HPI31884.1 SGNH/GDSL hydrolase family protein [candidate division Zixibacteria bacterium]
MPPRDTYPVLFRTAAVLLSLALFVALAEGVVRLAGLDPYFQNRFFTVNRALDYPEIFDKDHELFWRFRPDQSVTSRFFIGRTHRINSAGLHGPEITPAEGRTRVITLGNSCTFGWGVATEHGYPRLLDSLLGDSFQVINAGIPGYTSLQGKRFYRSDLSRLRPAIVTILFAFNDHWAAAGDRADKDQRMPPQWLLDIQNALGRLHTYRLLKKAILSAVEPPMDSLFDRRTPIYRVGLEDFRANLEDLCRMIVADSARPILLTSPIPDLPTYYPKGYQSNLHKYHERYNAAIREMAAARGYDVVDLAEGFAGRPGLFDDPLVDPAHFNDFGHRLAAAMIAACIRDSL